MLALFPSAAAAQSAGDDQYADPFGDEPGSPSRRRLRRRRPSPQQAPARARRARARRARAGRARAGRRGGSGAGRAAPAYRLGRGGAGVLGLILLAAGVALRAHVRRAA